MAWSQLLGAAILSPSPPSTHVEPGVLTQAGHGEHAGGSSGRNAVGEHGLEHIVREGHGDDRQAGGVHDEHGTPEQ